MRELNINGGLKWPNDIILNKKKIGGVLCETKIQNEIIEWIVIGIGINVNESEDDLDSNIVNNASSLFIELGQNTQRERVVANILDGACIIEVNDMNRNYSGEVIKNLQILM